MKTIALILAFVPMAMMGCTNPNTNNNIQNSGQNISATVQTNTINKIKASDGIQVNYTVGTPVSVKYTAPTTLANKVDITSNNGSLNCQIKGGTNLANSDNKVIVNVVAPNAYDFEAYKSAVINVKGTLNIAALDVEAKTAGIVDIESVNASRAEIEGENSAVITVNGGVVDNLDIEAKTSAVVTYTGTCNYLDAEASSSGIINAAEAKIGSGELTATSSGIINVSKATTPWRKIEKKAGGTINIK